MSGRLAGQRVLVTGGASGIGAAIVERLAAEGAHVLVNYRSREAAARALCGAVADRGGTATPLRADVTDPDAVARMLREASDGGGVHGLVHAASAPLAAERFRKTSWETFEAHHATGVRAAFLLVQGCLAAQPATLRWVVFVLSSVTLGTPPADKAAYVTGKHALLGLSRALAAELAAKGVRVNAVSPGFTPTELTAGVDPRIQELIAKSVPLKRLCRPEDVAASVAFLASDEAAYLTGVNLPVAGGVAA